MRILPRVQEALAVRLSSFVGWLDIIAAVVLFAFPILLSYLLDGESSI
jgi:hypothetical protein